MRKIRPLRKDSIFRLYLVLFSLATAFGLFCNVRAQRSANRRVVERLEARISELEARPVPSSDLPDQSFSSSDETSESSSPPPPLFFVLGHGYNKRYAYLDIEFNDGTWERFYFRPFPSRGELVRLHRIIEHHAFKHYFPLDMEEES